VELGTIMVLSCARPDPRGSELLAVTVRDTDLVVGCDVCEGYATGFEHARPDRVALPLQTRCSLHQRTGGLLGDFSLGRMVG